MHTQDTSSAHTHAARQRSFLLPCVYIYSCILYIDYSSPTHFLPPTISKTSDMLTMAFRPRPCLNQSHSPQNNYTTPYLLSMTLTMHRSTGTHHVVYFQNESCMVCLCSSLPETQSCRSRRGATADGGASMVWWMMWFVGLSSAFVDRASAPPLA